VIPSIDIEFIDLIITIGAVLSLSGFIVLVIGLHMTVKRQDKDVKRFQNLSRRISRKRTGRTSEREPRVGRPSEKAVPDKSACPRYRTHNPAFADFCVNCSTPLKGR